MSLIKKYTLTEEHRAQLKPWADKWISNALSTKPMDDMERNEIRVAIEGLYRAANLVPPPPHRIVFVPSPFVLRFAAGFAAGVWQLRGNAVTRDATTEATRSATDDATYEATTEATYEATRSATGDATRDATYEATSKATREATYEATNKATNKATTEAIYDATYKATTEATYDATNKVTYAATYDATNDAIRAVTYDATNDATAEATTDATAEAPRAATYGATNKVTRAATHAVTDAATTEATYSATTKAIYDATRDATRDVTRDATTEATRSATGEATRSATDDAKWWRFPVIDMPSIASRFGPSQLLMTCAQHAYRLWNGGNQWSGWIAFLSFFRTIVKLDIDYSQWQHYEIAGHAGPRCIHKEFCMISERPIVLKVDSENRPHCDDGPFCQWSDGAALFAVHGVRVPAWLILYPDRLTAEAIEKEENAEVRRVMIERLGYERYILESGAELIHTDDFGALYRKNLNDDEPLVMVHVLNATPEPDGSIKKYMLRVDPELRPMSVDGKKGKPQAMTARNAIASTFGMTGREYAPEVET